MSQYIIDIPISVGVIAEMVEKSIKKITKEQSACITKSIVNDIANMRPNNPSYVTEREVKTFIKEYKEVIKKDKHFLRILQKNRSHYDRKN